ncbi:MAG: glycosyltransferase [Candidatus Saccharimonadales bacterium]
MSNNLRLGLIGSFVPKKCGIATFGRDLLNGIKDNLPKIEIYIAAAESKNESYRYNESVVAIMKTTNKQSYRLAAEKLNNANVDLVLLQHEFGLFGGKKINVKVDGTIKDYPSGEYILETIHHLKSPLITTFHTLVPRPDPGRCKVINQIVDKSAAVITMTQNSKSILIDEYNVDESKIFVIHHGVPVKTKISKSVIIKKLKLNKRAFYLTMNGLLSDNKGVDLVIKALPAIVNKHPNCHLLVIGQTHPQILAAHGEEYRESLIELAKKLKVEKSITFINEFLETKDLMEYISISKLHLTPYRDPDQSASGTLAYAIGSDIVIISTPYRYAQELLAKKRGFLVPFEDSDAIAKTINHLIDKPLIRLLTKANIRKYGKTMAWPTVGKNYLKLINEFTS